MTTLESIRRLVAVIEPNDPQSEAIKQAVLALLEKEEPKTTKKEPAKKSPGGVAKKPGRKPFDTGKLKALLNGGWPVAKIADEMQVSEQTIRNHIKELGL